MKGDFTRSVTDEEEEEERVFGHGGVEAGKLEVRKANLREFGGIYETFSRWMADPGGETL